MSSGHAYGWHDGRLHALATTALAPGATYLGRWQVPLRVDGARSAIAGGLYFAASPSIVWFWPILVTLACVLAARRLRRPELDERVAAGPCRRRAGGASPSPSPASSCMAARRYRWGS